jgi:hypothetical protein
MVTRERLTFAAALETVTTVPTPPPSMMVVEAAEPRIFRLMLMVRFSVYVAAATLIESPEAAKEMARLTVLQAVPGDVQALLSLPLTPLTYHVVLAIAVEVRPTNTAANRKLMSSLCFMIFPPSNRSLLDDRETLMTLGRDAPTAKVLIKARRTDDVNDICVVNIHHEDVEALTITAMDKTIAITLGSDFIICSVPLAIEPQSRLPPRLSIAVTFGVLSRTDDPQTTHDFRANDASS